MTRDFGACAWAPRRVEDDVAAFVRNWPTRRRESNVDLLGLGREAPTADRVLRDFSPVKRDRHVDLRQSNTSKSPCERAEDGPRMRRNLRRDERFRRRGLDREDAAEQKIIKGSLNVGERTLIERRKVDFGVCGLCGFRFVLKDFTARAILTSVAFRPTRTSRAASKRKPNRNAETRGCRRCNRERCNRCVEQNHGRHAVFLQPVRPRLSKRTRRVPSFIGLLQRDIVRLGVPNAAIKQTGSAVAEPDRPSSGPSGP